MSVAEGPWPLCFDTSAIYGDRRSVTNLESIRKRFPDRRLLIPAWVVAEKARISQAERASEFRVSLLEAFLRAPNLGLEVVPFDSSVALGGWLAATNHPEVSGRWSWQTNPIPQHRLEQPCGERCRTGDYIVYALARHHQAVLVTEDRALLNQVQHHAYHPGACRIRELLES